MVGLIHTPRVLLSISKGFLRRRFETKITSKEISLQSGFGEGKSYLSYGHAGLLDCDGLMHMNNAAYLSHAEYARWELSAYSGLLQNLLKDRISLLVTGAAVRYRREIPFELIPFRSNFQIQSFVAHLDERNLWIYQGFRGMDRDHAAEQLSGRLRGQVVCQGLLLQGGTVLDPRSYLTDKVGMDPTFLQDVCGDNSGANVMMDLMNKFSDVENVFKEVAFLDDEKMRK